MTKEPETIGELYIYMAGEFRRMNSKIQDMQRFVYWMGGLSLSLPTVIFSIVKLLGLF